MQTSEVNKATSPSVQLTGDNAATNGALSPINAAESSNGQALMALPPVGHEISRMHTFIDVSTPAGKALVFNAMQGQDIKLAELIGLEINCENFVVAPVRLVNPDTGEETIQPRTVLITDKKERISCVSEGVVGSLRSICQVYGNPPWTPPLSLVARENKSNVGRKYYTLEIAVA